DWSVTGVQTCALPICVEVGNQQLNASAGNDLMDLDAGLRVQPGATVGKVVARHSCDGRVTQSHRGYRPGDPARLVDVERGRLARSEGRRVWRGGRGRW